MSHDPSMTEQPECCHCGIPGHDGLEREVERLRAALLIMVERHPFEMNGGDVAMAAAWFITEAKNALDPDRQRRQHEPRV